MVDRPYGLSGKDRVFDWIAGNDDPTRTDEMLAWLKGVCYTPTQFVDRIISKPPSPRRIYVVDLPSARTRITYTVVDVPARCVHILDVSDDDFGTD